MLPFINTVYDLLAFQAWLHIAIFIHHKPRIAVAILDL